MTSYLFSDSFEGGCDEIVREAYRLAFAALRHSFIVDPYVERKLADCLFRESVDASLTDNLAEQHPIDLAERSIRRLMALSAPLA